MPNMAQALRSVEIDGRIFFDLEHFLEMMFEASNGMAVAATEARDPALGIMATGVAGMCNALEAVLTAKQISAGVGAQDKECSRSQKHTEHLWSLARKPYRCSGLAWNGQS